MPKYYTVNLKITNSFDLRICMIQNRKGIHEISLERGSKLKGLPIIVPASLSIERNRSEPKR